MKKMRIVLGIGVLFAVILLVGTAFSGSVYGRSMASTPQRTNISTLKIEFSKMSSMETSKINKIINQGKTYEQLVSNLKEKHFMQDKSSNIYEKIVVKSRDTIINEFTYVYLPFKDVTGKTAFVVFIVKHSKVQSFSVGYSPNNAVENEHHFQIESSTHYYWWGWKVVLTEHETQGLILALGAAGATVAAIAALLIETGVPAGIAGVIAAFLLAGSADIAFIDWLGGNHGVYFAGTWWGNIWCWHN